jgi:transposase
VAFALTDLAARRAEITEVETRMLGVLDQLDLTELVTTIPGVSAIGAATILAEAGDPTRFTSARALVKHAGLCPRDNASGTYQGKTPISGRGRPARARSARPPGGPSGAARRA